MKMSPIIPLSFCCLAMAFTLPHTKPQTDLQKWGLKGKVKSIRQQYYTTKDSAGMTVKNGLMERVFRSSGPWSPDSNNSMVYFNESGMLTGIDYYEKTDLQYKELFGYTGDGLLAWRKLYSVTTIRHQFEKSDVYSYTGDGLIDSLQLFYTDSITPFSVYSFRHNPNGTLLEQVQDNNHHGFQNVIKYTHDSVGQIIRTISLQYDRMNREGSFLSMASFNYDKQGNRTQVETFRSVREGDWENRTVFTYDSLNRVIGKKAFVYTSKLPRYYDCTYDKQGNILQEKEIDEQGKPDGLVRYKYTYDDIGNWTTLILTRNNSGPVLYERNIIYY